MNLLQLLKAMITPAPRLDPASCFERVRRGEVILIDVREPKEWANGAARQMGLECQHTEGAEQDVLTFERMGVTGTMTVTGTRFELLVKLGLMMAAFKPMIEAEVAKNLGRIIDKASGTQA